MFKDHPQNEIIASSSDGGSDGRVPAAPEWLPDVRIRNRSFAKGELLFVEGSPATGIFRILSGEVKIFLTLCDGKNVSLEVAGPGRMIGLSSTLCCGEHKTSAEALSDVRVSFVEQDDARRVMRHDPNFSWLAVTELDQSCRNLRAALAALSQAVPVRAKLARLFLDWAGDRLGTDREVRMENKFTHQEIAEMLGTTRETVTRTVREFRLQGILTLRGSSLVIYNMQTLRSVAYSS